MEKNGVVGENGLLCCSICNEPVEKVVYFPLFDGKCGTVPKKVHVICKCQIEKRKEYERRMQFDEEQRKINELRRLSLMDQRLKEIRFRCYKITDSNRKIFKIASNYVEHFDEMFEKHQGILFWGNVGTGKSYTAAAIANELIDRKTPVIMTSFIKLLKEIGSFDEDTGYMDRLNLAKLLIIDDLGAERGTDYALEKVYDIIDSRYRSGKPIILTTNLEIEQMKNCDDIRYNRIYDRIFEMCYPVKVDGFSWRKREAASRFGDIKKILEG